MAAVHGLSTRVNDLHPSPIREILAVAQRPGMISFAGGLPSPDTFPRFDFEAPPEVLQYGASEGEPALRERIASELRERGLACDPGQVLVLSGSQQGIDLVAKLFIDPGTPVAVESPTYLAALQVFRFFGARFVPFSPGREGEALRRHRPAFAYVIPTFQNPTGHCYSPAQREALAEACDGAGVPVFEDDPYRDLAFDPCDRTPVCARLKKVLWIYQGSFSKSLAPGLRLGFLAASPELLPYLVRLKQAADLHSSRLSQWLVLQQLEHPGREERLAGLVEAYRRKRDAFAQSLDAHFGPLAAWEVPKGGLFFWLKLHRPRDTRQLLQSALERGVAFMPGEPFYPEGTEYSGALRLNFSHADAAQAERGLEILARLFKA
ncbi:MAG: GntR family transcriptional regulator [Rhodocyclaceae bacterium]|nr:GntR family transcriptional regulator [Rhodocyclaceae bacterium]